MKSSVVLVQLLVTALFAAVGGFVAVSVAGDGVDADRGGMAAAVPMMTEAQLRVGGASASSDLATTTITPVRILDTREGAAALAGSKVPWGALETRTVEAAGLGTIPEDAVGVVVNVTVLNATAPDTFLTLFPTGTTMPNASTINPQPNEVAFNAATVLLGPDGTFEIYNYTGTVDVIIDVTAYMTRSLADAVDSVEVNVGAVGEELDAVEADMDAVEEDVDTVEEEVGRLQDGRVFASPFFTAGVEADSGWAPLSGSSMHDAAYFGVFLSSDQVTDDSEVFVVVILRSNSQFVADPVEVGHILGAVCYRLATVEGGPLEDTEICTDSNTGVEYFPPSGNNSGFGQDPIYRLVSPRQKLNGLTLYLEQKHVSDGSGYDGYPASTRRFIVRLIEN